MGLKRLDAVALEQEAQLAESEAIEVARERLFPRDEPISKRRVPKRIWAAAAFAAIGVVVLWLSWTSVRPAPLTFDVDGHTHTRTWVGADGDEKAVRFSDGSNLVLRAGARARVSVLEDHGAELALESGEAALEVAAVRDARWLVVAGPYRVRITGTRFDVSWMPTERRFRVVMHEGRVEVEGPTIDGVKVVLAGQTFERHPEEPSSAHPRDSVPPPNEPPPTTDDSAAPLPDASAPAASVGPSWRELAAKGSYRQAYEKAHPHWASILTSGSAADVATVADLARYAGAPGRAREAYRALRSQHAGSMQATRAAYTLGLMAFGGNRAAAVTWFETYLAEAPNGALAREALGRILEVQRTPAAAQRYLGRYPQGPHAELAQSILDRDG